MKKKVVSALLVTTMVFSLAACGKQSQQLDANGNVIVDPYEGMSKKELKETCANLQSNLDGMIAQYNALQDAASGAGLIEENIPNITDLGDGTNRMTFQSIDGMIEFSEDLVYPESAEAANNSRVYVSDMISFKPYENWLIKQKGVTTELNHEAGITAKISVGDLTDATGEYPQSAEDVFNGVTPTTIGAWNIQEKVLEPWFSKLANVGDVKYSRLYTDDQWLGMQGKTTTLVNGAEAHLVAGMFRYGEESCQYVMMYTGTYDTLKEEYMNSLISSIKVGGELIMVD